MVNNKKVRIPGVAVDCELGRKMEINMAEVINEIKHIKEDQGKLRTETKEGFSNIMNKIDSLSDTYATKIESIANKEQIKQTNDKITWLIRSLIIGLLSVVSSLITYIIYTM